MENPEIKNTRKLSAIMFVDIFGYSKMMGEDEEATLKLMDDYKPLLTSAIKEFNGSIVKWMGDGVFCEFNSVIDAADCGLKVHNDLGDYNKSNKSRFKILVRIGIHLGEVTIKDKDLLGDGVNVAARIEPLAPVGGIAVSGTVYSTIKAFPRFKIQKMKQVKLRNIDFKHELYSIITGHEINTKFGKNKKKLTVPFVFLLLFIIGYFSYPKIATFFSELKLSGNDLVNETISSDITIEEKYQSFYENIVNKKNFRNIIDFLQVEQKNGKLSFGNESDFHSKNNKCIIVLKEYELNTVLLHRDNSYYDFSSKKSLDNIKTVFIGNRLVWVELY